MFTVEAPDAVTEARGGLLSVANVIENPDGQLLYQGVQYQQTALTGHNRVVPESGTDKVFDKVEDITSSEPFSIYRGVEFSMFQQGEAAPTAKEAFGAGESYAVEQAIRALWLNAAVDLTPTAGTPVTNMRQAIGLLEQHAAEQYSGQPIIHANRYGTSLLSSDLVDPEQPDFKLFTKQGSPVANGGGYGSVGPNDTAAPAGAAWVFATGQVNIWRGTVHVDEAPVLKDNRWVALAEATYVATVDTFVAAVLIGV
jgi:hypothetical protein